MASVFSYKVKAPSLGGKNVSIFFVNIKINLKMKFTLAATLIAATLADEAVTPEEVEAIQEAENLEE
jgi:hypothetical protein